MTMRNGIIMKSSPLKITNPCERASSRRLIMILIIKYRKSKGIPYERKFLWISYATKKQYGIPLDLVLLLFVYYVPILYD